MDKYAMVYTGLGGCVKASCTGERGERENLMCMEESWCTQRVHDVHHSVIKLWTEEKGKKIAGWK